MADVHANLAALERVIESAHPFDEIWALGDLVGYGPQPNEVVARLRSYKLRSIVGNHDLASIGKVDLATFHPDARFACEWTAGELHDDGRRFLQELEGSGLFGDVAVAHGSPRDPIWEYVSRLQVAVTNFGHFATQACLIGHTHVPCVYRWHGGMLGLDAFSNTVPLPKSVIELGNDRLIINPGSVGQPRDGDPRAAYACYEPETRMMSFHRVEYDVDATQAAIRQAGLPDRLAVRLQYGT